jgi:hypothetical protein
MIEKCKKAYKFCIAHWKEIGATSIGVHLLLHEIPMYIILPLLAWLGVL